MSPAAGGIAHRVEISHPVCEIRGDETDWAQEGAHVGAGGVLLHRVGWGAPHPAPSSLQQASCSHLCPHLSNPTAFELPSSCPRAAMATGTEFRFRPPVEPRAEVR